MFDRGHPQAIGPGVPALDRCEVLGRNGRISLVHDLHRILVLDGVSCEASVPVPTLILNVQERRSCRPRLPLSVHLYSTSARAGLASRSSIRLGSATNLALPIGR